MMQGSECRKTKHQNQHIQVFVRCRPLNSIEKKQHSPSVVKVISHNKEVVVNEKINDKIYSKKFSFDEVFGPQTEQIEVYLAVVQPLIEEVLTGYNCTVFAYGQTGTGKTYTMEGERTSKNCSWEEDPAAGIIPRSLHQLFEELTKQNIEFSVRVSFMELYNEELFDLLSPSEDLSKLRLFEDATKKGSVVIHGLEEIAVHSKDEVYTILEKGTARRQTAATMMNASSSRSHTVFSVTIHMKENTMDGEELIKTGKLNLVDLAGSENIGRSGAVDMRAREAGNINQSLLTLGRVITSLVEKASHIPYRESKLTRLLQDSLGGRTKTSIIATISPALCNIEETNSTLDYAHRAKDITNRPEVNQIMTKRAVIKEYTEEIERLRRDLAANREKRGIYVDSESYRAMKNKLIALTEQLKELQNEKDALEEKKAKIEKLFYATKDELDLTCAAVDEEKKIYEHTNGLLQKTSQELNFTQKALCKTALEQDEKDYLISVQMKTEKELSQQAQMVLEVADQSTSDISALHAKIARKHVVEQKNEESSDVFKGTLHQQLQNLDNATSQAAHEFVQSMKRVGTSIEILVKYCAEQQLSLSSCFQDLSNLQNTTLGHFSDRLNSDTDRTKIWADRIAKTSDLNRKKCYAEYRKFLAEEFHALCLRVQCIINSTKEVIPKIQHAILEKLSLHESAAKEYWNQQKLWIANLQEIYNTYCEEEDKRLKRHAEKSKSFAAENAEFYKELSNHIHSFQRVCDSVKAVTEKQKQRVATFYPEMNKDLSCSLSNNIDTHNKLERHVGDMLLLTKDFIGNSVASAQDAAHFFEEKINAMDASFINLSETLSEIQTGVSSFYSTKEQEQKEEYEMLKSEIDNHLDTAESKLQEKLTCIKEMRSTWKAKRSDQECQREVSKKQFEKYSNDQLELLSELDAQRNKWTKSLKGEILHTGLAVEKFLTENLQRDEPTGETPVRKNYPYPRSFVCTSPHERILERFRLQPCRSRGILLSADENLTNRSNSGKENQKSTYKRAGSYRHIAVKPSSKQVASHHRAVKSMLNK